VRRNSAPAVNRIWKSLFTERVDELDLELSEKDSCTFAAMTTLTDQTLSGAI
jgi:hypothetical protein